MPLDPFSGAPRLSRLSPEFPPNPERQRIRDHVRGVALSDSDSEALGSRAGSVASQLSHLDLNDLGPDTELPLDTAAPVDLPSGDKPARDSHHSGSGENSPRRLQPPRSEDERATGTTHNKPKADFATSQSAKTGNSKIRSSTGACDSQTSQFGSGYGSRETRQTCEEGHPEEETVSLWKDIQHQGIAVENEEFISSNPLLLHLKAFARTFNREASGKDQRTVSVFIQKHGHEITEKLKSCDTKDAIGSEWNEAEDENGKLPVRPTEEDIRKWTEAVPLDQTELYSPFGHHDASMKGPNFGDDIWQTEDLPNIADYARFIRESFPDTALMSGVGQAIQRAFLSMPSFKLITRTRRLDMGNMVFAVDWNPLQFFHSSYGTSSTEALQTVICLTGHVHSAQATTVVELPPAFGSFISAQIRGISPCHTYIVCYGTVDFVSELGEQIAWIGSALRTAAAEGGVATCSPQLEDLGVSRRIGDRLMVRSCGVRFHEAEYAGLESSSGLCWRSLFRKPVLAIGFPILRRPIECSGLEMTLDLMATLIKSRPSNKLEGLEGLRDLQNRRHFVGWCPNVTELTGRPLATPPRFGSGLASTPPGFSIDRLYIEAGTDVVGGLRISLGKKDKPILVGVGTYQERLRRISERAVVYCDVHDRRVWLTDGDSALLHLVRAAIRENQKDPVLQHSWVFDIAKLVEGEEPESARLSAIPVLSNFVNLNMGLYVEEGGKGASGDPIRKYFTLKNRVEQDLAARDGYFFRPTGNTQKPVIGFDFWDLAKNAQQIEPRIHHLLYSTGPGWAEFVQSIQGTVLFGRGFGDMIEPKDAGSLCPEWKSIPPGRDYLVSSVSTLQMIRDRKKEPLEPGDLTKEAVWWCPKDSLFKPCPCLSRPSNEGESKGAGDAPKHASNIHFLLPKKPRKLELNRCPKNYEIANIDEISAAVEGDGDVVFGNRSRGGGIWSGGGKQEIVGNVNVAAMGAGEERECSVNDGLTTSARNPSGMSEQSRDPPSSPATGTGTSDGPPFRRPRGLQCRAGDQVAARRLWVTRLLLMHRRVSELAAGRKYFPS
ncbi:hypothetical protein MKZ38_009571 [Zalerion maritima]|uniref:Uncharacterized protein n=1 Tax=Zalerion maritima TaxID=339359 RepID=A0AAD5RTA5_9PEZI|nr:hypothetical protein MKZ38_009571 [Zalerion maritima]